MKYRVVKGHEGACVTVFLSGGVIKTITISDNLTPEEVQLLIDIQHPAIELIKEK